MKAVIFDLDGTLLDVSESVFWQYEQLTRELNGVQASREAISAALREPAQTAVRQLITNFRAPDEHVQRRHNQLRTESLQHLALYPHVDELLPILRRLGLRLAVVATDNPDTARHLERLGLLPHIHALITTDHVPEHSDRRLQGVQLALRHLDMLPHEVVVVGDTARDIAAGKQARAHGTIGITHGSGTAHELRRAGADHIVQDVPSLLDVLG